MKYDKFHKDFERNFFNELHNLYPCVLMTWKNGVSMIYKDVPKISKLQQRQGWVRTKEAKLLCPNDIQKDQGAITVNCGKAKL